MVEVKRRGRQRGGVKRESKASPLTQAFIDVVDKHIEERNMSRYALAIASGLSQPGVKRLLDGDYANVTLDTFVKLSKALGLNPTQLLREVLAQQNRTEEEAVMG